jgi:hypothetical protein
MTWEDYLARMTETPGALICVIIDNPPPDWVQQLRALREARRDLEAERQVEAELEI